MEYDSTLFVRLLPPAPAAFFGTFAAFLPPVADGVLAILIALVRLWRYTCFQFDQISNHRKKEITFDLFFSKKMFQFFR